MTRVVETLRTAVSPEPETLTSLVSQLVDDGRTFITAEIDLAKARATDKIGRYRSAAIFFGVAAVLGLSALIFALAPATGPFAATLIVVGVVVIIAGILAMMGKSRLSGGGA